MCTTAVASFGAVNIDNGGGCDTIGSSGEEDIDETSDQMIGLPRAYAFEPVIVSPDEHSRNEDSNSSISSDSDSQVSDREPEKGPRFYNLSWCHRGHCSVTTLTMTGSVSAVGRSQKFSTELNWMTYPILQNVPFLLEHGPNGTKLGHLHQDFYYIWFDIQQPQGGASTPFSVCASQLMLMLCMLSVYVSAANTCAAHCTRILPGNTDSVTRVLLPSAQGHVTVYRQQIPPLAVVCCILSVELIANKAWAPDFIWCQKWDPRIKRIQFDLIR